MGQIQEFISQYTKECFRIIATISLSLHFPISFLFIVRQVISTIATDNNYNNPPQYPNYFKLTSILFLNLFTFTFSIAALIHGLSNGRATFIVTNQRRRFLGAWVLLYLIEVSCFYLLIRDIGDARKIDSYYDHGSKFHGSKFRFSRSLSIKSETEIDPFRYFSRKCLETLIHDYDTKWMDSISFMLRRVFLFVGLHETMVLWRRSVVVHAVDEKVLGFNKDREHLRWVERVVLAVAYCFLWWRSAGEEAEALVGDVAGWWLYYLTVAIGVVLVVRSLAWLTTWTLRYLQLAYKSVNCNI